MKKLSAVFLIILFMIFLPAETVNAQKNPDPRGAFLRSLAMPGWGHYYADRDNWFRGQIHFVAEVALIATYFGLDSRAGNLENQYITLSSLKAGADIAGRNRAFRLAVGDFISLSEYNDYQLRSRNWHRLYDDVPENRWEWQNEADRRTYRSIRSDADRLKNQLPAVLGLMVVNRVVSGISALNRAKNRAEAPGVSIAPVIGTSGVVANLKWNF